MKHCPFCAEKIRDEAVKCRYCGEWLNERSVPTEASCAQAPSPNVIEASVPAIKAHEVAPLTDAPIPPNLPTSVVLTAQTKFWKIFLYALLLALATMFVDALFGVFISWLTTVPDRWFLLTLLYALDVCLGLVAADFFYKLGKPIIAVAVSIALLVILRIALFFLITNTSLSDYVKSSSSPNVISTIALNTALEIAAVFGPLLVWGWFLNQMASRLSFTTVSNVRRDLKDKEGDKFDDGTCGRCGQTTIVAVQGFTGFLGKRERFFCQHCRTFMHGNPLKAMVDGLAAAVISFVFLCGFALTYPSGSGSTSTAHSLVGIMLIVGVCAGLKRTGASAYAFAKSYSSSR